MTSISSTAPWTGRLQHQRSGRDTASRRRDLLRCTRLRHLLSCGEEFECHGERSFFDLHVLSRSPSLGGPEQPALSCRCYGRDGSGGGQLCSLVDRPPGKLQLPGTYDRRPHEAGDQRARWHIELYLWLLLRDLGRFSPRGWAAASSCRIIRRSRSPSSGMRLRLLRLTWEEAAGPDFRLRKIESLNAQRRSCLGRFW